MMNRVHSDISCAAKAAQTISQADETYVELKLAQPNLLAVAIEISDRY